MYRICCRVLAMAGVVIAVAAPTFAQDQPGKWDRSYQLTPLDHKRLRAKGLSDKEVYKAANVARLRHADVDYVADFILRGAVTGDARSNLGLMPKWVETPRPEWTTPEWQAAVERGDWLWIAPASTQPGMAK